MLLFEIVEKSVLKEDVCLLDKFSSWRSTVHISHNCVFDLIFLRHNMTSTYRCRYQAFQCHYLFDYLIQPMPCKVLPSHYVAYLYRLDWRHTTCKGWGDAKHDKELTCFFKNQLLYLFSFASSLCLSTVFFRIYYCYVFNFLKCCSGFLNFEIKIRILEHCLWFA